MFRLASKFTQKNLLSSQQVRGLNYSIQRGYFEQFLEKYECRKILLRENKPLNEDYRKTALNPGEKVWEKIKDNKKKLIFFLAIALICQYTGGYEKLVNWWKYKEPMKRKLMRWIFGVNNVMPATLIEQRLDEINIPREARDILQIEFREKEKALKLGLTRKYLYLIYRDLELFPKEEDKHFFYSSSGYSKKRNQKPAGINLREFLRLYQQGYEKATKQNSKLTELEFRQKFLASLSAHFEKMKDWEQKFLKKRNDFRKMMMENEKKVIIKEALQKDPLQSMNDLEATVRRNGLLGVGVKEKILVLNKQLTLLQVYKNYYEDKKEMSFGEKTARYTVKLDNVEAQIADVTKQLEEQNAIFSGYFKNVLLFKEYAVRD